MVLLLLQKIGLKILKQVIVINTTDYSRKDIAKQMTS